MKELLTSTLFLLGFVTIANAQSTHTSLSSIDTSEFGIYLPVDTTARIRTEFRYDRLSRLILVFRTQRKTIVAQRFEYDEVGNRTREVTMNFYPDPGNPTRYLSKFNKAEFAEEKEKILKLLKDK